MTTSEVMWMDSRIHSPVFGTWVQSTSVFPVGVVVGVIVEGTFTNYPQTDLLPALDIPIMYPSPLGGGLRDASREAEGQFASPTGSGLGHDGAFVWDLTESGIFAHIEPIGGPFTPPQPGHIYSYQIVGEGFRFRASFADNLITDNNGMLKITMTLIPPGLLYIPFKDRLKHVRSA